MCTKILKKESSSRALAFLMLMFMIPLGFIGNVQNCGAMELNIGDDVYNEKIPLKKGSSASTDGDARRDVKQGGNDLTSVVVQSDDLPPKIDVPKKLKIRPASIAEGDKTSRSNKNFIISVKGGTGDVEQGKDDLTDIVVQSDGLPPKIGVSPELKVRPNPGQASAAVVDIEDALYHAEFVAYKDTPGQEKNFNDDKEKVGASSLEGFFQKLVDKGLDGIYKTGPLQTYLKNNGIQINALIDILEKFEGQETILFEREQSLQTYLKNNGIQINALIDIVEKFERQETIFFEREQSRLVSETVLAENKSLNKTNMILKICIPVTAIVTGLSVWGLTMYLGGKWNK